MRDQLVETTTYSLAPSGPPPPERRSDERFLTLLRVGVLHVGERRELCLIRNISTGGVMIRCYSSLEEGTALSVELKQGQPLQGTVQWRDGDLVGIGLDQPIDVVGLIAPSGPGPRPRMPRVEVDCTAWVRQGASPVRTRVVNVSQGGICISCAAPLAVGLEAVVTLPGLTPAPGMVRWGSDEMYGIGFNRPLVLGDLVEWLQHEQQHQRQLLSV